MAESFVEYTTSGVGPYPITMHVPVGQDLVVTLDGAPLALTTGYTLDAGNLNLTLVASSTGAALVITRVTPLADGDLPVTFTSGAAITKQNLDASVHDLNHKIQELYDQTQDLVGADGADGVGDEMMIFMGL